jgi:ABC-type sugar transport system substrate-binding protein
METVMRVRTTAVLAVLMAAALSAAGCSNDASMPGQGGGPAAPAAPSADCPLASAPDPGNSAPPANVPASTGAPKLAAKDTYRVAFSQNASNNPWRLAETASMQAEAQRLGYQLTVTDANNEQAKQIQDIKGLIAQRPDALFMAPITEQLGNVVVEAAHAGIPVFLLDRDVDTAAAKPGEDYVTVVVSDFVQQGRRAAWAMAQATGGHATIIELEGTTGSSPAIDRKKGFDESITQCPGMRVVVSQSADFTRAEGQSVTETLLQSHPDATAIYAHNDEMALGAISAIRAAGKVPGQDIKIVSIDGSKDALTAVDAGELYATVESNPRFGPKAFETMQQYAQQGQVPVQLVLEDRLFNRENAAQNIAEAY